MSPADQMALRQLRDDILAAKPGPDGSLTIKIPAQHAKPVVAFMQHIKQQAGAMGAGPGGGGPPPGGPGAGGPVPGLGGGPPPIPGGKPPGPATGVPSDDDDGGEGA